MLLPDARPQDRARGLRGCAHHRPAPGPERHRPQHHGRAGRGAGRPRGGGAGGGGGIGGAAPLRRPLAGARRAGSAGAPARAGRHQARAPGGSSGQPARPGSRGRPRFRPGLDPPQALGDGGGAGAPAPPAFAKPIIRLMGGRIRGLMSGIAALSVLVACGGATGGGTTTTTGADIILGAPLSLTGSSSKEGGLAKQGYDMWQTWVNQQGGINVKGVKHKVQIKYADDQSKPDISEQLTQSLITDQKVQYLLGP